MQFTRNILKTFRKATPEQYGKGLAWYSDAHNLAFLIGRGDVWKGAGLLAVFSPLTPWWRNVELAETSAFNGIARTDTLGNSSRLAQRILDGEDVRTVIKGIKTRTFAENIALNGISDKVTVDSHAFSIAVNKPTPAKDTKMGIRVYREIADCYKRAASIERMMPTQMQAITWVVWRDLYPNKAANKEVAR